MNNGNSAERERFEKWYSQREQHDSGLVETWNHTWEGWQARAALSVCADGGKGEAVAIVESWTNGSYHRNYNLRWLKDVPKGAALYTAPRAECAPRAPDLEIQAAGTLIAIGRLLTEAGFNPELRIIEAVREVIAKAAPQAECATRADADTAGSEEPTAGYYYHHGYEAGKAAAQRRASNERADAEKDAVLTDARRFVAGYTHEKNPWIDSALAMLERIDAILAASKL